MTSAPTTAATPGGLGGIATILESARQTLLMLRYRRLLFFVPVVLALMFGFAFVVAGRAHDGIDGVHLYCVIAWWGLGTVVVPWMTLYLGVQAVHGELDDRTSQYLFLRPVRRVPLLLGKWLAVALVASGIACAAAAANRGRSSRPAAMPPVLALPASSRARTSFARFRTAGGRPASRATARP